MTEEQALPQVDNERISILLVDDHAMFREGVGKLLEAHEGFKVVGECGTSADALATIRKRSPQLVLLDVDLGNERALDFVTQARKAGYEGKILIVTAGISGQEAIHLIQSGVAGIIHKQHTGERLCAAIAQVASGGVYLEREYLAPVFRSVDRTRAQQKPSLTDREKVILRYIFQGLTNKEIGDNLEISEGAVKAALRLMFRKMGVRTRAQLVKVALERYRDQF